MDLIATCAKGLEPVLAEELAQAGLEPHAEVGAVRFQGDWPEVWGANLWLRTANRILWELGGWRASRKETLYGGLKRLVLRWPDELFHPRLSVAITSSSAASEMRDTRTVTLVCKDALVDAQRDRFGSRSDIDRDAPDLPLRIRLWRNRATLLLDTSGSPLDRRGYRVRNTDAPARENLAAAMLLASGWDGRGPVIDPMCGSGTLLAEAGRIVLGLRPTVRPRPYAFQNLPSFDAQEWKGLTAPQEPEGRVELIGGDIDRHCVEAARANLSRARLSSFADIQHGDMFDFWPPDGPPGLVLLNPPYGERVHADMGLRGRLGQLLRERYRGWRAVILSGGAGAGKGWGMQPRRNLRINNGPIAARILVFEL